MRKDKYFGNTFDLPKISKQRSFFDLTHSSHLSMNAGLLVPLDQPWEIVPGDTWDVSHRIQVRMPNPPKTPTMDQLVFDIFYFYVPNRIVWKNWDSFITGDTGNDYSELSDLSVPQITFTNDEETVYDLSFSLVDYLGVNILKIPEVSKIGNGLKVSVLPFRGYYKIWNEYFRYQSLQDPVLIRDDDVGYGYLGSSSNDYWKIPFTSRYDTFLNAEYAYFTLMRVNRLPDYFSTALPQPVAGPDVKILNDVGINDPLFNFINAPGSSVALYTTDSTSSSRVNADDININSITGSLDGVDNSIRALSQAFALNKLLYIDNIYGRRITEWTYGHYGVSVPDERVQRPEYLCKRRIYINMNQIMQSSATTEDSPQGNAGAWSLTYHESSDFLKSFVEFGYVFCLGCVRVLNHTYAQGIPKGFMRKSRFDYYMTEFNNVGDQSLLNYEVYFDPTDDDYNYGSFGYVERYADYKYLSSRVAGHMRPQAPDTLAVWTYTDYYEDQVFLSDEWKREPIENIDRTFFFDHETAPQFIIDMVFDIKAYRTMPYNSMPGGLTNGY